MSIAPRRTVVCGLLAVTVCLATPINSRGQGEPAPLDPAGGGQTSVTPAPPVKYGPLEAGQEAYQRAETERRAAIARQLQTLDSMAWYSGAPGQRIPPSLESIYAYPRTWRMTQFGIQTDRRYSFPYREDSRWATFEPWPLVPGDIFASPWLDRVRQPAGHEIIATGPNSYLYRPVYPVETPPVHSVTKARDTALPRPPEAHPPARLIPKRVAPQTTIPPAPSPNAPPVAGNGPRIF